MDVTIIGSGAMARGIATRFAAAGANVQLLDRKPENAQSLAGQLSGQVTAGGLATDAITGDVVVLAVPYGAVAEIAERIADQVPSRIVVDITNPVDFSTFDGMAVPPDSSGAQEIEKLLPDASVVKAFNTTFASTLLTGSVAGQPLDVFLASDDPGAVKSLSDLIDLGGMRPIPVGPLRRARELEAMGYVHMLAQEPTGAQYTSALKVLS